MADINDLVQEVTVDRCVGIQITNDTGDVTLKNPRTYFVHGCAQIEPKGKIDPGSKVSCVFVKKSLSVCGCVGVLSYESNVFTLAIMFSNPFNRILYNSEFAIEVFTGRKHFHNMESLYQYMCSLRPPYLSETFTRLEFKNFEDRELNLSNQEIQVKTIISHQDKTIMKVQIKKKVPCPSYTPYPDGLRNQRK